MDNIQRTSAIKRIFMGATNSVQIATYWLAQGMIEGIQDSYLALIRKGIKVDIVIIDPNEHMINILSKDMHISPEIIGQNIKNAYNQLCSIRETLSGNEKRLLRIGLSSALPQDAVIMIDAITNNSKIQLEFRPHRAARNNSFSIELNAKHNGNLHHQLEEAWGVILKMQSMKTKYLRDHTKIQKASLLSFFIYFSFTFVKKTLPRFLLFFYTIAVVIGV